MTHLTSNNAEFGAVGVSKVVRSCLIAVAALGLPACGGEGGGDPGLEPPCELARASYRVDRLTVPETSTEAMAMALDVDQDAAGRPDNLLGQVQATFTMQGLEFQPAVDEMVAAGDVVWTLHVETCADGSSDYARVLLEDDAGRVSELPSVGAVDPAEAEIATWGGDALAPLPALISVRRQPDFGWFPASGVSLRFTLDADGGLSGSLGGGLSMAPADRAALIATVAATATDAVADDPGCPDACGTWAAGVAAELDRDGDGVITPAELEQSDGLMGILRPDLDLEDADGLPGADGESDHMSFAIAFHATPL